MSNTIKPEQGRSFYLTRNVSGAYGDGTTVSAAIDGSETAEHFVIGALGHRLVVTINDNLTGLVRHTFRAGCYAE